MILIKGAGELASGIAWRLVRCGFQVAMTEVAQPLAVRRTVSFCSAVYTGTWTVEGVTARLATALGPSHEVALFVDPDATCVTRLRPAVVVDAIMAKRNLGTSLADAPVVIGVGPGFTAGVDCHAVVETQRGHWLGRAYYEGSAIPDTGVPAERGGQSEGRIVRAPASGAFVSALPVGTGLSAADPTSPDLPSLPTYPIGARVAPGDLLGHVGPHPVRATIAGILRGLVFDGTPVTPGLKIGDIDPICEPERCHSISDKALAVAGGVLEALLHLQTRR